jgi:hypothetical protein
MRSSGCSKSSCGGRFRFGSGNGGNESSTRGPTSRTTFLSSGAPRISRNSEDALRARLARREFPACLCWSTSFWTVRGISTNTSCPSATSAQGSSEGSRHCRKKLVSTKKVGIGTSVRSSYRSQWALTLGLYACRGHTIITIIATLVFTFVAGSPTRPLSSTLAISRKRALQISDLARRRPYS